MASSRPQDAFGEIDTIANGIYTLTVDNLKVLINLLNTHAGQYISKTGRKAELVDRVINTLRLFRAQANVAHYKMAVKAYKDLISRRSSWQPPTYLPSGPASSSSYGNTSRYGSSYSYNNAPSAPSASTNGPTTVPHHRTGPALMSWKVTPAWKAIKAVTDLASITGIEEGENHRRLSKSITIRLEPQDIEKLQSSSTTGNKKFVLRLFCTSSEYYPSNTLKDSPLPIEFPNNCELTLNSTPLKVTKGLKGKANSAPPADLMQKSALKQVNGVVNILMFAHIGPSLNKRRHAKKFYFQVCLVEWTGLDEIQRVIVNRAMSIDTVLQKLRSKVAEDDIEVGATRLSLKCPLSYIRIKSPMRSDLCTHMQCCDLDSWMMINETTPSWTCPSCDRELPLGAIFVDQFFLSILDACPDSVDEVVLEPSGEWHTEDGKYGSAAWKTANPNWVGQKIFGNSNRPSRTVTPDSAAVETGRAQSGTAPNKASESAVLVVDDSDDDDDHAPRISAVPARHDSGYSARSASSVSVPLARGNSGRMGDSLDTVIDLCDSDDEDAPRPPITPIPTPATLQTIPPDQKSINGPGGRDVLGKRTREDEDAERSAQRRRLDDSGDGSEIQARQYASNESHDHSTMTLPLPPPPPPPPPSRPELISPNLPQQTSDPVRPPPRQSNDAILNGSQMSGPEASQEGSSPSTSRSERSHVPALPADVHSRRQPSIETSTNQPESASSRHTQELATNSVLNPGPDQTSRLPPPTPPQAPPPLQRSSEPVTPPSNPYLGVSPYPSDASFRAGAQSSHSERVHEAERAAGSTSMTGASPHDNVSDYLGDRQASNPEDT